MKIVTDGIDMINSLACQGLLESRHLEILVSREHWNSSNPVSRRALQQYLLENIIQFIGTDEISYSQVFALQQRFKGGLHLKNCILIEYCLSNDIRLVTSDMALLRVAKELNSESVDSELFVRQLHLLHRIPVLRNNNKKLEKIEMKVLKKLGPG